MTDYLQLGGITTELHHSSGPSGDLCNGSDRVTFVTHWGVGGVTCWLEQESGLLVNTESEGRTGVMVMGQSQESEARRELKGRTRVMVKKQSSCQSQEC